MKSAFTMPLPPHEIVYAPNGDISYVKMYSPAEDYLQENIYEKVVQEQTVIYIVGSRKVNPHNQPSGSWTTGTAQRLSALPPLIQRIFQKESRSELEALVKSGKLPGFVIKP